MTYIYIYIYVYPSFYLISVIRKVDLMENLRGLVLNGLDLDLMRRIFPLTVSQRLLKPLNGIQGDRVASRALERAQFLHQGLETEQNSLGI